MGCGSMKGFRTDRNFFIFQEDRRFWALLNEHRVKGYDDYI